MDRLTAVAAVILTGVVLVGLFVGPSNHRAAPPAPPGSDAPRTAPLPVVRSTGTSAGTSSGMSTEKVIYQLPPAANRPEDRTRLMAGHARRRSRTSS